jgi:hypothetical protein
MDGFVARQTIEHYREMLKITTDLMRRRLIEKLLLEQEAKLKKTRRRVQKGNSGSSPRPGPGAKGCGGLPSRLMASAAMRYPSGAMSVARPSKKAF